MYNEAISIALNKWLADRPPIWVKICREHKGGWGVVGLFGEKCGVDGSCTLELQTDGPCVHRSC